ncbi:MAG: hypothetical protein ACJ716_18800 [Marmoricola sp.]
MSEAAVRPAEPPADLRPGERSVSDRIFDRMRWGLIAAWVVLILCLPIFAERESSWENLRERVASGAITHVQVNGELLGGNGFATVDLHWREHGLNYRAEVIQLIGDQEVADCAENDACVHTSRAKLHSPPSARLQDLAPGLTVDRNRNSNHDDDNPLLGFGVPGIMIWLAAILVLLGLGVLISAPRTWRATKWAWFWWLSHPLGMAAFLLLSGPTALVPAPRRLDRRLTGGWSLVLSIIVSSMSITVWNVTLG